MAFQFSQLLQQLKLQYPCSFSSQSIKSLLTSGELKNLSDLTILKQSTIHQEIPCPNCEDGHFVPVQYDKNDKPFIVCNREGFGKTYIKPDELKIWQFDVPRFLGLMARELKIIGEIKNVVANDLWQVGTLQKNGKHFLVFYSRTNDLNSYSTFFDDFKSPVRAFVVFTNTETPPLKNERVKAVIPLADIIEIKNKLLVWNTKLFQKYLLNALRQPKVKTIFTKILIKDARLDEQNYLLEINNGEKVISFKSKKKIKELDFEEDLTQEEKEQLGRETLKTKQWKILYHLWDFRWELKDGRVLKKGDYTSLDNLVRGSGSKNTEAAYKHIQRLNNRFKDEGVAIEIKGENEKYRLIINKA